jgi:integrase
MVRTAPAIAVRTVGSTPATFKRKVDAQRWLDEQTAAVVTGTWVDPKTARTTVADCCDTRLAGYATRRPRTVRQAEVHMAQIQTHVGRRQLASLRPSDVRSWTAKLEGDGLADSYVYALHNRLSQVMSDAVHDGILARNPCSRRTSPGAGKPRPFVATTAQVWALHDALPERLGPAILLGAFVGLRTVEAVGLRVIDVDFMRGTVRPAQRGAGEELKTEISRTPLPIPQDSRLHCRRPWPAGAGSTSHRRHRPADVHLGDRARGPTEGGRTARGVPFHDLRHYLASLLIGSGLDVKVVQHRLRHRISEDDPGHLRASVAPQRRVRTGSRWCGSGCPCGLCADYSC